MNSKRKRGYSCHKTGTKKFNEYVTVKILWIYLRKEEHCESDFSDEDSEEQMNNKSNRKPEETPDKTIFSEKNEPLSVDREEN